jgi:hypothetical protein
MVSAAPGLPGKLSLGLVGMDWSDPYNCVPVDEDEDLAEMDSHLAAVSALLDDADGDDSGSTLRSDAPEFVPMSASPMSASFPRAPAPVTIDGPALTSTWIDSSYRVTWRVPSTKLVSKDKIVVSPPFGDRTKGLRTFKFLLQPRAKGGDELGSPAFGSTRFGSLQLKCVEDCADESPVCFRLFIGDELSVLSRHDFKSCAVAVHEHLWDLRAGVDSGFLNVGVEFLES